MDENTLKVLLQQYNPNDEPAGPFAARCSECGSTDLWDDNLHYGCNRCHAILG